MNDFLIFTISDVGIYQITNKKIGEMGELVYLDKIKLWSFLPKEDFFYKPVHLGLILRKLNELNNYKKEDNKS